MINFKSEFRASNEFFVIGIMFNRLLKQWKNRIFIACKILCQFHLVRNYRENIINRSQLANLFPDSLFFALYTLPDWWITIHATGNEITIYNIQQFKIFSIGGLLPLFFNKMQPGCCSCYNKISQAQSGVRCNWFRHRCNAGSSYFVQILQ